MITFLTSQTRRYSRAAPSPGERLSARRRSGAHRAWRAARSRCRCRLLIDDEPTGSIKPKAAALSATYDLRDWRVAEPVLAASLRAPRQGSRAGRWSNPRPAITANSSPSPAPSRARAKSCRAFVAQLVEGRTPRRCRRRLSDANGEVAVYDASPWTGL